MTDSAVLGGRLVDWTDLIGHAGSTSAGSGRHAILVFSTLQQLKEKRRGFFVCSERKPILRRDVTN